jgi:hypothetical protein
LALLRASGRHAGLDYDLDAVMRGDPASDVPHGGPLLAFADAALGGDEAALTHAREAVRKVVGDAGLSDAAAVIGGFDGITRIADATGIPLEPDKAELTADFFDALDIGRFRREKT